MLHNRPVKKLSGAVIGLALCISSTAAGAAATPASSISPLVALSAFGTQASSSAVCAAALQGTTVLAAAAQAPAPGTGCVLPAVDAPVPVAQPAPPPPPVYAAVEQPSFGLLPVLLGLAAIAGIAALLLSDDEDGDIDLPGASPD